MNEMNKKYLERMLEGCISGLEQVNGTIEQMQTQMEHMVEQKEEMETGKADLEKLLEEFGDVDKE